MRNTNTYKDIDSYIQGYPKKVQMLLKQMRATIKKAGPKTEEAISYGIPTFKFQKKNLVHFGGFKDHVSFFPGSAGVEKFKKELAPYVTSKGTIQFSLDKKLPLTLVAKIVKFRVAQSSMSNKK
ncbi:MAG: DUF1801 domain-containing protein [Patescibacteria group bacterium]